MRRVNLVLEDRDFAKLERWARFQRSTVGACARSVLMVSIESELSQAISSGRLEQFEQVNLFRKAGKK